MVYSNLTNRLFGKRSGRNTWDLGTWGLQLYKHRNSSIVNPQAWRITIQISEHWGQ